MFKIINKLNKPKSSSIGLREVNKLRIIQTALPILFLPAIYQQ